MAPAFRSASAVRPRHFGGHWTVHRGLHLRSGMAAEGMCWLDEAGALADDAGHVAGIAAGSAAFYRYLRRVIWCGWPIPARPMQPRRSG